MALPKAGDGRTAVHLETAGRLASQSDGCPVLGGAIGPLSLAGRLFGVSDVLELSLTNPELLEKLLGKTTQFLIEYMRAFRDQGADGVIMAEPVAGLLSPKGLNRFSSTYIRQIVEKTQSEKFSIVYHNCGAKFVHLSKILEAGADVFHFGAPMDLGKAIEQVGGPVILSGNLDPSGVFKNGTPQEVAAQTTTLMKLGAGHINFIPSSGCDLPPHTPLENLDAFFQTVSAYS